nr:ABC transporter permease subunit [Nocardia terpenica]
MLGSKGVVLGSRGVVLGARGDVLGSRGVALGAKGDVLGSRGVALGAKGVVLGSKGGGVGAKGEGVGGGGVRGPVSALWPRVGVVIERCADLAILLPAVLALLLVVLSWPSAGTLGVVLVAIALGIPYSARVFAAAATGIAATGYVEAARLGGESVGYLIFREMLPNMRELFFTQLGLRFVEAMYIVATAAFLRLPTSLGSANWAVMVRDNVSGILLNPWAVLAPSLAIGIVAVSVNLLAAALGHTQAGRTRSVGDRQ